MIINTDDPQVTQAEIMDNNTITGDNVPPQDPLDINTESYVGNSEKDTYKKQHKTSIKRGASDLLPMDEEASKTTDMPSPKRTKKPKTERDPTHTR
jgi:hypothetical protein